MQVMDISALRAIGINYCRSHLWRKVKQKEFPKPIKLGGKRNAWLKSDIDDWLKSKVAERDAGS